MNIPKDGGWGKPLWNPAIPIEGQGSGLLERFLALPDKWLLGLILALTASLSFGVGLVVDKENNTPKDPLWIEQLPPDELPGSTATSSAAATVLPTEQGNETPPKASIPLPAQTGQYVASKTGKKYYLPSCSGAKRIKDENKVWFATKQEAESAGYSPSSTCKGM